MTVYCAGCETDLPAQRLAKYFMVSSGRRIGLLLLFKATMVIAALTTSSRDPSLFIHACCVKGIAGDFEYVPVDSISSVSPCIAGAR